MTQKPVSLRGYAVEIALECLPQIEAETPEARRLRAIATGTAIEAKLLQMPGILIEQLSAGQSVVQRRQELQAAQPEPGASLWAAGAREADLVDSWPPSMANSRDPERFVIGKDWFEAVTGATLGVDMVELRQHATLPRYMLVHRVRIARASSNKGGEVYALLEGKVSRPYQAPSRQYFYPGDLLRKLDASEMTVRELKLVRQARAMLQTRTLG